jgi:hypothetical protein
MALNILMSTGHIADVSLGHDSLVVIGNFGTIMIEFQNHVC